MLGHAAAGHLQIRAETSGTKERLKLSCQNKILPGARSFGSEAEGT